MVKNLRKLRTSMGISQQHLADVIGTSQQSINKYENHNVEPDIQALIKIADFFETTIDYLVGHNGPLTQQDMAKELELSKDEFRFIQGYRRLSEDEKKSIQMILHIYLKNKTALEK